MSGFLQDERGSRSMGRLLLACCLIYTAVLIPLDAATSWNVADPAWAIIGGVFTGLLAWVAGPRVTQHIGEAMSGVAKAKRSVPFGGSSATAALAFTPHEWTTGDPHEGLG